MAADAFVTQLNEQIAHEYAAHQQYVAIAVYYDAETLPQLAGHFYRQAVEERNHAMMLVQYLLDAGERVVVPGVDAPRTDFSDATGPVALALEQEKTVTQQIASLVELAFGPVSFAPSVTAGIGGCSSGSLFMVSSTSLRSPGPTSTVALATSVGITSACPPRMPSLPTSRATRVTSEANPFN